MAFVALLMSLCHVRYSASQYALFSAVSSLGRVFIGPLAADIVLHVGWISFFLISIVLGLPSLLLLYWMRYRVEGCFEPEPSVVA